MQGYKSIFGSVTFWGLVLSAAAPLAVRYGFELRDPELPAAVAQLVGLVVALWGRVRATERVSLMGGRSHGGD